MGKKRKLTNLPDFMVKLKITLGHWPGITLYDHFIINEKRNGGIHKLYKQSGSSFPVATRNRGKIAK